MCSRYAKGKKFVCSGIFERGEGVFGAEMRFRVANSRGVRQPVIQYVQSVWSTVRQFCFVRMLWGVGERILATWGVKRVG